LYGRYGGNEITIGNGFEKIEIAGTCGPRRERDKGRLQREASVVAEIESAEEICARVTLFKFKKDSIIDRFDRAGDEQAAGACECLDSVRVAEKVLDFNRDVIGQPGVLCVERFNDTSSMSDAVEEIGIAKCNVLASGRNLLANVGEDYLVRDDTKLAGVNGNNWAVAAQMLTSAGRLGIAGNSMLARGQYDVGVFLEDRQSSAIWNFESKTRNFCAARLAIFVRFSGSQRLCEVCQFRFKHRTQNGRKSRCTQVRFIQGRVKTTGTQAGRGILGADHWKPLQREPRCGVHGEVKYDQFRIAKRGLFYELTGKIEAIDGMPAFAQPSGRGSQSKRLAAEFISG